MGNMNREVTVFYQFAYLILDEGLFDSSVKEAYFEIYRKTDDTYETVEPSRIASSGDKMFFEIKGDEIANEYRYDLNTCKIIDFITGREYTLINFYDEDTCIEDFLGTGVSR